MAKQGFMSATPTPSGQKKNRLKGDMHSDGKGAVGKPAGPGGIGGKKMSKRGGKK